MQHNKKLISILEEPVYSGLWKGIHTKEYIIDFLNVYFRISNGSSISNLELIDALAFTNSGEIQKRIHVMFTMENEKYYYEIKLCNGVETSKYFDFSLLPFVNYCWDNEVKKQHIGQIILNFEDDEMKEPIMHFIMQNENIQDEGIEIHILSLSLLSNILKSKSLLELNYFERWILALSAKTTEDLDKILDSSEIIKTFAYSWKQLSKYKFLSSMDQDIVNGNDIIKVALSLLEEGFSVSEVSRITGLECTDILMLQNKMGG